jgi:hypothetical protein
VYGGAGGNYYGLIQFGGPERAKYLDKSKLGNYTIAEQMPAVERFLRDRGFQPGKMGIDRAYATILGGNPNVSLTAKDSFGTSVASSIPKFKSGGSLYKAAQTTLGDPLTQPTPVAAPQPTASGQRSVEEILSSALQGAAKPELNKRNSIADAMKETVLKSLLPDLSGLLNPFGFLQ